MGKGKEDGAISCPSSTQEPSFCRWLIFDSSTFPFSAAVVRWLKLSRPITGGDNFELGPLRRLLEVKRFTAEVGLSRHLRRFGCGSKLNRQKTRGPQGFGPCCHFPEFHLGYLFLTHSQLVRPFAVGPGGNVQFQRARGNWARDGFLSSGT